MKLLQILPPKSILPSFELALKRDESDNVQEEVLDLVVYALLDREARGIDIKSLSRSLTSLLTRKLAVSTHGSNSVRDLALEALALIGHRYGSSVVLDEEGETEVHNLVSERLEHAQLPYRSPTNDADEKLVRYPVRIQNHSAIVYSRVIEHRILKPF